MIINVPNLKVNRFKLFNQLKIILYLILAGLGPTYAYRADLVYFQTNDDFTQMMITSGILYGEPSAELLFTSKPLSLIISQLYLLNQNFSWYTIVMLTTLGLFAFGFFLLLDSISNYTDFYIKIFLLITLIGTLFYFLIFFFELQFTQTSILATGVGFLLSLFHHSRFIRIYGLILMSLGIFWRPEAGLLVIALAITLIAIHWAVEYKKKPDKPEIIKFTYVIVVVGISLGIALADLHKNSPFISSEKQLYIYHYDSLGKVLDYNPTINWEDKLYFSAKQAGWSRNDFTLLVDKFYFANSEVYSSQKFLQITDLTFTGNSLLFLYDTAEKLNLTFIDKHKSLLFYMIIALTIILFLFGQRKSFVITLYLLVFYFLNLYILSLGRIPDRVLLPLVFIFILSIIIINVNLQTTDNKQLHYDKRSKINFFSLCTLSLIFGIFIINTMVNTYYKVDGEIWWKQSADKQILNFDKVLNFAPDRPIIAFSSFYSTLMKTHSPTKPPSKTEEIWKHMILIGWAIKSPEMLEQLDSVEISEDLFSSLIEDKVYLATSDHAKEIYLVNKYLTEHTDSTVSWSTGPIIYNDTGLGIWKVVESN